MVMGPWASCLRVLIVNHCLRIRQDLKVNQRPGTAFFDGPTPNGEPSLLSRKRGNIAKPLQADILNAFNKHKDDMAAAAAASIPRGSGGGGGKTRQELKD